ncbi:MAG: TRAP transporter large permease [Planctomycetota bacterium]|jgi:C4-dicarboxylate transporter DctM subunit|nr:TRAP transporter large permease [Planctomycetota bacterium]
MDSFIFMMALFVALLFLGLPISICIGMGVSAALVMEDISLEFVAQICFSGLNNYTYIAIPMFILAGLLMETGGLSQRLVDFASSLIGNIPGGLGIITVLSCMFFAAISGSSPATVAAIGSMMLPQMARNGYDLHFAGALTACAGSMGILIPPSIPMIIYAITAEVSIGEIFTAGFIPGALIGGGLMLCVYLVSRKRGYRGAADFGKSPWQTFRKAIWSLLTPVIILGGIYAGIFTATEAAVVAVLYALVVGLYIHRELKFSDLYSIFLNAALTTGSVIVILGFATAFARYLTMLQIPQMVGKLLLSYTNNPTVILCLFVLLIFFTGMFIETASQILIYTPLFLPILVELGVSPVHFGIILVIGTEIGLITPPVGVNLFVVQGITKSSIVQLTRNLAPFLFSMVACQTVLVLFPGLVMFLPNLVYGR